MARGGMVARFVSLALIVVLMAAQMPASVEAQAPAPAPAPTSDGHAIDQGIACFLLFLALVLTYLIPLDAFPSFF